MNTTPEEGRPPRKRILCVDDEPTIRETMSLLLRQHGCEVEVAPDGLAAWSRLAGHFHQFDAVITDNQMPHLTGVELVEKLRAEGFPGKILFFSSTLCGQAADRLKRLRVDAVVEKGGPFSDLMHALDSAFA